MEQSMNEVSDRFLYVFVNSYDGMRLLYKFDALRFLHKGTDEGNFSPLVVFNNRILPKSCKYAFTYLDGNFFIIREKKRRVFTFSKSDISELVPKENRRGNKFVASFTPMLGDKVNPLAFTYKRNLYVLSRGYNPMLTREESYDFEVYESSTKSWKALANKPSPRYCVKSHIILGNMVYFTIENDTIFSFNLEAQTWSDVIDPFDACNLDSGFVYIPPTFDDHMLMIKDKVFGVSLHRVSGQVDVCSSPCLEPSDKYFLHPTLAQDQNFYLHLYSGFLDLDISLSLLSTCIVTLNESDGMICVVSYAGYSWDDYVNYACLSFFKVIDGSFEVPLNHESKVYDRVFYYANDPEVTNAKFFQANFISTTMLPIKTEKLKTVGEIYGCLFV